MNLVTFCRTLGDSTRWRIVRLVSENALCACELSDILGMPQSSVSSHIQVIRKSGLLEFEKREKWTYFRVQEHYLVLLRHLEATFAETDDPLWKIDDKQARNRLAQRERSCCPGPIRLALRPNDPQTDQVVQRR